MNKDQPRAFSINQKVKISEKYHWAKGETGFISNVPEHVKALSSDWKNDFCRVVNTKEGQKSFFWIRFESAQFDTDGEGPYMEAEIEKEFLELMTS